MRALRITAVAAGLLAVAACGHRAGRLAVAPPSSAMRAGVLSFSQDGPNLKLASALDVTHGLMLECERGAGVVHLTHMRADTAPGALVLASAGARSALASQRQSFGGRDLVIAEAPARTGALRAFRRSGRLDVSYAGATSAWIAGAAGATFMERCGRA